MDGWRILFLTYLFILQTESYLVPEVPDEVKLTMPKMAEIHGYEVNEHVARTDDGYHLRIHRMKRRSGISESIPILLVHGIIGSSEDYLRMGPKRSIGYLLTDRGYDVWLGNLRGNLYTSHQNLSKNDKEFWNYSIAEHGKYDVPSMVKKVLEITNSSILHYIGYSMGTTSYFIACSKRPDVMSSVATYIALAPVINLGPNVVRICRFLDKYRIPNLLERNGINVILENDYQKQVLATMLCNANDSYNEVCMKIAHFVTGADYSQVEYGKIKVIAMKLQPASIKQLKHYIQVAVTGKLSEFDYGEEENMRLYGTKYPPKYNISANTAPTILFYGPNDYLAPPMVVRRMSRNLKSKSKSIVMERQLPYKQFNHLDFVFSRQVDTLINNDIINAIPMLMKYSNKNKS